MPSTFDQMVALNDKADVAGKTATAIRPLLKWDPRYHPNPTTDLHYFADRAAKNVVDGRSHAEVKKS